jgi:hypothetical protein
MVPASAPSGGTYITEHVAVGDDLFSLSISGSQEMAKGGKIRHYRNQASAFCRAARQPISLRKVTQHENEHAEVKFPSRRRVKQQRSKRECLPVCVTVKVLQAVRAGATAPNAQMQHSATLRVGEFLTCNESVGAAPLTKVSASFTARRVMLSGGCRSLRRLIRTFPCHK